jgi:hypothetical protein
LQANGVSSAFVEITFYGTGINIITAATNSTYSAVLSVDGGSEGSNIIPNTSPSGVIGNRNYAINSPVTAVSGLTLGIHTVKIRNTDTTNGIIVYGFEILNEQFLSTTANTNTSFSLTNVASTSGLVVGMDISGAGIPANTTIAAISGSTITMSAAATATATGVAVRFGTNFIKVNPGTTYNNGVADYTPSQQTSAYNSGFDSIVIDGASAVSLGSKGGRVLVYQKVDGTVGKSVTAVNASAAYLSSASHTYEEVIRTHYPREFGAGRTDDFSTVAGSSSSRAFTLDDGTTTLVVPNANINDRFGVGYEHLSALAASDFITLTFVGTGLDITVLASTTSATFAVTIDGSSVGSLTFSSANTKSIRKICSGLPYGTHTVKFAWTVNAVGITAFTVYGPKKPVLPTGAVKLADYNVMADFVAATTGVDVVGSGVLRKASTREFVYTGSGFSAVLDTASSSVGWAIRSATNTDSYRYTFFGTGFDFTAYGSSATTTATLTIDGSLYTGSASVTGTATWTPGTSTMTFSAVAGAGRLRVSGLALGIHTIVFTITGAQNLNLPYVDIITPIHSPKSNLLADLQNTLPVGSCGISDNRVTTTSVKNNSIKPKAWAKAVGISSGVTTTSSVAVPMPDMSITIKTNGGRLRLTFNGTFSAASTANFICYQFYVNGVAVDNESQQRVAVADNTVLGYTTVLQVPAGTHKVDLYWRSNNATTLTAPTVARSMIAEEL